MATASESDKTPAELEKRVWELIEKIRFCMYSTWDGTRQHQRPLTANGKRDEGAIYFLVDAEGCKNWETEKYPDVALAFADPGKNDYVTVSGKASLTNNRAKIKELWSVFAKAWWKDANDPAIRLLTVYPEQAEVWEGPNRLVAGAIMLAAAATGKPPPVGDHGHVRM